MLTLNPAESTIPQTLDVVTGSAVSQHPARPPAVTVIVPCYNYARFLPAAVDSALAQDGVQVEVLIVDDASTDGSAEVATRLAARDGRVRLIARPRNGGPVASFNDGLAAADGEYLIRLDADDLLTPGSVARATALAERYPAVGLVYGHPLHFASRRLPRHRDRATRWDVYSGAEWLELRCRLGVNCITSPEVVMRKNIVDLVGGQRSLAHTHDMEMWFRLAREADVGWVGGSDQAWHREHADSRSARQVDVMTDLHERAAAFEMLFTDGRGDPDDNARLLGLALGALANEAMARASSAYAKGRGGTPETDRYLEFADNLGIDLAGLRFTGVVREALRLGPARSRLSPYLIAQAAAYRLSRELGRPRWRSKGM
ncbi:glycosyltransferase [Parafrigoribacterium mesophilum]|uniref:glycosyltransferase family 2 protein n=1 Tax=Parafrigoribacterium mesophilum TaxID=433646 RepID=UPI0031FDEE34